MECAQKNKPIDEESIMLHPIYSECLSGLTICTSGLKEKEKETISFYGKALGAEYSSNFNNRINVLISKESSGQKCKAAIKNKIPIVKPEWISKCWEQASFIDFNRFRLPIFNGLMISITGLSEHERKTIEMETTNRGGLFSRILVKNCTHLVSNGIITDKHTQAEKWNIPIVSQDWFMKSIQDGYLHDENLYLLNKGIGTSSVTNNSIISSGGSSRNNSSSIIVNTLATNTTTIDDSGSMSLDNSNVYSNKKLPRPTPMPSHNQLIQSSSSALTIFDNNNNSNTNNNNEINNSNYHQELIPFIAPLFQGKNFLVKGSSPDEVQKLIGAVSQHAQVIDESCIPSTWTASTMNIHYILCEHGVNLNSLSEGCKSIPIVSVDWFDKCLKDGIIYDPSHYVLFRPLKNLGFLEGLSITSSGFSEFDTSIIRMTAKLLSAKFTGKLSSTTTHLIVASPTGAKYDKAVQLDSIFIISVDWLYDSALEGYRLPEENYINRNNNFIENERPKKIAHIKDCVRDLGGALTESYFDPVTHFVTEEASNDIVKFVTTPIVQVNTKWVIDSWNSKIKQDENLYPPKQISDDDKLPMIQSLAKTPSQLFNASNSNSNSNNLNNNNDSKTNNDTETNDQELDKNIVVEDKENSFVKKGNEEVNDVQVEEENNENKKEDEVEIEEVTKSDPTTIMPPPKSSELGVLINALHALPEKKSSAFSMVMQRSRKPYEIQPQTSIVAQKPILNLSLLESDENLDPMKVDDDDEENDNNEEDENENSQRVTYGEDSELYKRKRLMESRPFYNHNNYSSSSFISVQNKTQQHLMDILQNKAPPPPPKKTPHFIFSGFPDQTKTAEYSDIISKLGGIVDESFLPGVTTHLVSMKPNKSEKVLCSYASGIWILVPSYIEYCREKGRFEDEVPFEWSIDKCSSDSSDSDKLWAKTCKVCRIAIHLQKKKLFANLKIGIANGTKNADTWKKILESGGASIFVCKEPFNLKQNSLTHAFISKNQDAFDSEAKKLNIKIIDSAILTDCLSNGQHLK
eukprot:gene2117-2606_t